VLDLENQRVTTPIGKNHWEEPVPVVNLGRKKGDREKIGSVLVVKRREKGKPGTFMSFRPVEESLKGEKSARTGVYNGKKMQKKQTEMEESYHPVL